MSQPCDREGTFRGVINGYGLKEMDSGAVGVALRVLLTQMWNGEEWIGWSEYDMEAEGDVWIIKKVGAVNEAAAQSLIKFAGWDGNLLSITEETWEPKPVAVVVKRDEYEGKTRFKIAFVNDHERTPGGLSNVDAAKAKELNTRFGAQLRALVGNNARNGSTPPPTSKPSPPPIASAPAQGKDIPF